MLSFGKILLLVIVVVIAVIGFRLVSIMSRNASAREQRQPPAPQSSRPRAQAKKSADLTACPKCGAYSDGRCDRPDCGLAR